MNTINDVNQALVGIADSLRGEIDLDEVNLPLMALITLKSLMDNSDHPYEIPSDWKWAELASNASIAKKQINETFTLLEKSNQRLEGVFTSVDLDVLNDKILFQIVQRLSLVSLNRSKMPETDPLTGTLAKAMDDWLLNVTRSIGLKGGAMSSPSEISDLLVNIVRPFKGSVYDGAVGLGGNLIKAASFGGAHNLSLYGQEIHELTWTLCKMNLILHGLYDVKVFKGNTLEDPPTKENRLQTFDTILMEPPFKLTWKREQAKDDRFGRFRYGIPGTSNGDMAFVLHAVSSLTEDGKAALVVTHGLLFRGGIEQQIRRALVLEDLVEAVIGLPSALYPNTRIPVAVLILNNNKPVNRKGKVLMINAEEGYERVRGQNLLRDEDIKEIVRTFDDNINIENYSAVLDIMKIEENEWKLTPSIYFDKNEIETSLGKVRIHASKFVKQTQIVTLKDTSEEIFRGIQVTIETGKESQESTYKLLNMSDIQNGEINLGGLSSITITDLKRAKKYELREGDLVISARGMVTKVAVVPKLDEAMILSHNLIAIRLNPQFDAYYIKAFLESPIGLYYLNKYLVGSNMPVLLTKDLGNMPISALPLEQQQKMAEELLKVDRETEEAKRLAEAKRTFVYRDVYHRFGLGQSLEFLDSEVD